MQFTNILRYEIRQDDIMQNVLSSTVPIVTFEGLCVVCDSPLFGKMCNGSHVPRTTVYSTCVQLYHDFGSENILTVRNTFRIIKLTKYKGRPP